MLGRVTQEGWKLTFRGRKAPQEAGVSVNVFFYLKKVGRQCKEETTENQSENGKQDALEVKSAGSECAMCASWLRLS